MQTEVLRYERDRLLTHKSMVHALTRQRAMHECEIDKHYQHQHQERENSELSATVAAAAAKDQLVTLSTEHDKLLSVVAEQRATIERLQASLFAKEADLQRAHAAAAAASTAHAKALAAAHAATEAKAERMAREHAESLADVRARADVVVRAATMLVAHPPDPTQPLQLVRLGARSQTMPVMGGTGETVGAVFRRLAGDDGGMLDVKAACCAHRRWGQRTWSSSEDSAGGGVWSRPRHQSVQGSREGAQGSSGAAGRPEHPAFRLPTAE